MKIKIIIPNNLYTHWFEALKKFILETTLKNDSDIVGTQKEWYYLFCPNNFLLARIQKKKKKTSTHKKVSVLIKLWP